MTNKDIDRETIKDETIRDITSFGNLSLLALLCFAVIGFNNTALIIVVVLFLLEGIGDIIKLLFFKERPRKRLYKNINEKITASSFPSLHVTRNTFMMLSLFNFSDSNGKIIFLIAIPLVAMSRIYLKKHDYYDVLGGLTLGIVGFIVFVYISSIFIQL